jgi:hypothetical protein
MSAHEPFDPWIRDKMKDWSAPVPDRIWNNIQEDQDRKRGFWFWFTNNRNRLSMIGTLLLLTTGVGIYLAAYTKQPAFTRTLKTTNTRSGDEIISHEGEPVAAHHSLHASNMARFKTSNSSNNKSNALYTLSNDEQQPSMASTAFGSTHFTMDPMNEVAKGPSSFIKYGKHNYQTGASLREEEHLIADAEPSEEMNRFSKTPIEFSTLKKGTASIQTLRVQALPKLNIPCPPGERYPRIQYLEMYGGTDLTWREFSDDSNSGYLKLRASSTQTSLAYNLGIRYVRVFKNNWLIRAGLHYGQINERFNFKEGNVIQTTFILNNSGDTTGSYQTSFTRFKTTYNRYRTFDLPFSIGRQFIWEKWKLQLDAGAVVNLRSINTGEVLSLQEKPVSIHADGSENPYQLKRNIGIGLIGSIGSYYQLNDQWAFFAETNMRYNPTSMTQNSLSLKQKFHTGGIRLGVRINLTPNQQK